MQLLELTVAVYRSPHWVPSRFPLVRWEVPVVVEVRRKWVLVQVGKPLMPLNSEARDFWEAVKAAVLQELHIPNASIRIVRSL